MSSKFSCDVCAISFASNTDLKAHKGTIKCQRNHIAKKGGDTSVEIKGKFKCKYCGHTYTSRANLKKHQRICTQNAKEQPIDSQTLFRCCGCPETFKTIETLRYHQDFDCPQGKKLIHRAKEYVNPRRRQKIDKNKKKIEKRRPAKLVCDFCRNKFKHPVTLKYHERFACPLKPKEHVSDQVNVKSSGDYFCLPCKRNFTRFNSFTRHRDSTLCKSTRIAAGEKLTMEKKFQCEYCSETFTKGDYLNYHLKNGKCLGTRSKPPEKQKSFLKPLNHKCDKCSYKTNREFNLRRHKNSPNCKKNQLAAQEVERLLYSIPPDTTKDNKQINPPEPIKLKYLCRWCDAIFNSQNKTLEHMRTVHDHEIEEDQLTLQPDQTREISAHSKIFCCYICLQRYKGTYMALECITTCENRIGISTDGFVIPIFR